MCPNVRYRTPTVNMRRYTKPKVKEREELYHPIKVQKRVFSDCTGVINQFLDVATALPHLRGEDLTTEEEFDVLSNPQNSRQHKINTLIKGLPLKGEDFLYRFLRCLRNTTDGTAHEELVQKIHIKLDLELDSRKLNGTSHHGANRRTGNFSIILDHYLK